MTDPLKDHTRRRTRQRILATRLDQQIDMDILRGWREQREPSLASSHLLPPLARLTLLAPDARKGAEKFAPTNLHWTLYGPSVYLGRYHASAGPVDILFEGMLDHELYKITAPHALLEIEERGHWTIKALSPTGETRLDGEDISFMDAPQPLGNRQLIKLGVATFRFDILEKSDLTSWRHRLEDLLRVEETPALFLKRAGGVCGPRHALVDGKASVLGRSFPSQRDLVRPSHWNAPETLDWDLSGVLEHERRFIAFRHAIVRPRNDHDWEIEPLNTRQATTINRLPITEPTILRSGDEIGLGSLLFHFHHPRAEAPSRRDTVKLPKPVDWHSERVKKGPPPIPGKREKKS